MLGLCPLFSTEFVKPSGIPKRRKAVLVPFVMLARWPGTETQVGSGGQENQSVIKGLEFSGPPPARWGGKEPGGWDQSPVVSTVMPTWWSHPKTQVVKNLSATQEMWVPSLGLGDPLKERMATTLVFSPENPRDRGAWRATVIRLQRVAKTWQATQHAPNRLVDRTNRKWTTSSN